MLPGEWKNCLSVFLFFFSLLNFLVGQAEADKGELVVSRHIADFWQNSPSAQKFTHFLAPGQAVLVGLGMAFLQLGGEKRLFFFPTPHCCFLWWVRGWKAPVCRVGTAERVKL